MRVVFRGGSVLDQGTVALRDLAVDGDEIVEVADPGQLPLASDDQVYDAAHLVLMPGLHMCHWHGDFGFLDYDLVEVIGAKYPPGVQTMIASRACDILLASGVTGIAGAGCSNDIDAALVMASTLGVKLLPRLLPSGPMVSSTGQPEVDVVKWWEGRTNLGTYAIADGPFEMRKLVRTMINRGAKIIKILYSGGRPLEDSQSIADRYMSLDELRAVVETAHERGCKVRAHVAFRERIVECIEAGVDLIDHGDEVDSEIARLMGERGTFWVPSALFLHRLVTSHRRRGKVSEGDEHRDRVIAGFCETVALADGEGARILLGDDYGFAFIDHRPGVYGQEISMWTRDLGFPVTDVLRWATVNGAQLLGSTNGLGGTLKAGAPADLIALRHNPLAEPTLFEAPEKNLAAVMVRGSFAKNELAAA